jgi:hypothetical protein
LAVGPLKYKKCKNLLKREKGKNYKITKNKALQANPTKECWVKVSYILKLSVKSSPVWNPV